MLTLRAGRQPQRRAGTAGRPVRRTSETATKVPLSKKCKLDIKRKHLRAAIPGCLAVNSYAVNLQLQIDGENLPDLYKCTIKKHVNNKTSCVSYRLQGTGIYNHLRGLYMRGFSYGEEPGVVLLVASRKAAPDLSYSGQSDGGEGDEVAESGSLPQEDTDTERERRQQRQRRQQRPRQQRKRRREDTDTEDEEQHYRAPGSKQDAAAAAILEGPSGREPLPLQGFELGQAMFQGQVVQQPPLELYHYQHLATHCQQGLRSHPVHASQPDSQADDGEHVGLQAHALSGLADSAALICHETADDDAVSALAVAGVEEEVAAAVAEVERRAAQVAAGPGPGSAMLPVDPFDHLAIGMGLGVGLGGISGLGDSSSSILSAGGVPAPTQLLGLGPDGCGGCAFTLVHHPLHESGGPEADADLGCGGQHHVPGVLPGVFNAHRDSLLDLPLSMSPFSPRLLHDQTGRLHAPRGGGGQQSLLSVNPWGPLPPLDFELWPRQPGGWADSLGLGLCDGV